MPIHEELSERPGCVPTSKDEPFLPSINSPTTSTSVPTKHAISGVGDASTHVTYSNNNNNNKNNGGNTFREDPRMKDSYNSSNGSNVNSCFSQDACAYNKSSPLKSYSSAPASESSTPFKLPSIDRSKSNSVSSLASDRYNGHKLSRGRSRDRRSRLCRSPSCPSSFWSECPETPDMSRFDECAAGGGEMGRSGRAGGGAGGGGGGGGSERAGGDESSSACINNDYNLHHHHHQHHHHHHATTNNTNNNNISVRPFLTHRDDDSSVKLPSIFQNRLSSNASLNMSTSTASSSIHNSRDASPFSFRRESTFLNLTNGSSHHSHDGGGGGGGSASIPSHSNNNNNNNGMKEDAVDHNLSRSGTQSSAVLLPIQSGSQDARNAIKAKRKRKNKNGLLTSGEMMGSDAEKLLREKLGAIERRDHLDDSALSSAHESEKTNLSDSTFIDKVKDETCRANGAAEPLTTKPPIYQNTPTRIATEKKVASVKA